MLVWSYRGHHFTDVLSDDGPAFAFFQMHGYFPVPAGVHVMRHVLTITVALLLTHQPAHAADISVVTSETADHPALILMGSSHHGRLLRTDGERCRRGSSGGARAPGGPHLSSDRCIPTIAAIGAWPSTLHAPLSAGLMQADAEQAQPVFYP